MLADFREGARQRMLTQLKSTGLYRLDGSTVVEKELRIYSDFLGELEYEIRKLADNCFLDTLDRDGILALRRLYALPAGMSAADLKEIAQLRAGITNRDFTREGVLRCMAAGGFQAEIMENFTQGTVTVTIRSDKGAFGTREEAEAFLRGCLPFHLVPDFVWPA